jgi:hypothetical protein
MFMALYILCSDGQIDGNQRWNCKMTERELTPEAKRALAEAAARRKSALPLVLPPEFNGGKGPEPTRFGDWEKKGIASDF